MNRLGRTLEAIRERRRVFPREVAILVSGRDPLYCPRSTRSVEMLQEMARDLIMGDGEIRIIEGEAARNILQPSMGE